MLDQGVHQCLESSSWGYSAECWTRGLGVDPVLVQSHCRRWVSVLEKNGAARNWSQTLTILHFQLSLSLETLGMVLGSE